MKTAGGAGDAPEPRTDLGASAAHEGFAQRWAEVLPGPALRPEGPGLRDGRAPEVNGSAGGGVDDGDAGAFASEGEAAESHHDFLLRLTAALSSVDDHEPEETARRVGRALVGHGLSDPGALQRTVAFLAEHLRPHLVHRFGANHPAADRAPVALGALAAGFAEAVAERAAAEVREEGEAKFRAVWRTSALAIAEVAPDGRVVDHNAALPAILGYPPHRVAGLSAREVVHPDDLPALRRLGGQLRSGERDGVQTEKRLVRADGEAIPAQLAITPVRGRDGDVRCYVAVVEDLDEVRALQLQLVRQSLNDPLTGLANRAQFLGWLESEEGAQGSGSLVVALFDLDGFRVVNGAFGHEVGDRALRAAVSALGSVFGGGARIARVGGDEFGVLVTGSDLPPVLDLVERALRELAEPVWWEERGIGISASVGVVARTGPGLPDGELLRRAGVALDWAKGSGKAGWALYDPDRDARERDSAALAASVAGGTEQGDFRVDYEPVHALADRSVVAVEAVLRWDHAKRGLVDLRRLGPLLERTGMGLRLERWALERACARAGRWFAALGEAAPVLSVDLSVRQCQEPELVAWVRQVLRDTGLPPRKLRFELPERLPSALTEEQVEELNILASHGVLLALDQLGGGNVAVDRIRQLPLSALKFGGPPVRGLAEGANLVDRAAAVALLSWSRKLGLELHAVHVSTSDEARRLRELGVSAGQGVLFNAEPLTEDDVAELLGLDPDDR
ncbi:MULTISPECIES: bifunctional diguanylate cyclase/phosphodiesterase [Actinosynnema]|uniref:putative bifunctional diguanylate cyclase/phosphodiesterase n=1 Tax=Actinosynnema TaxID=40566 RepID=UPI0020A502E2|nr:EAL domain-containing protein [Actinosynnema pretiosum]MCP2097988.1 PAS domain S-box-containing protein/diguanylate cyclase (GGDEF) domain-containing protein [Actinosynnema pretiosum]